MADHRSLAQERFIKLILQKGFNKQ